MFRKAVETARINAHVGNGAFHAERRIRPPYRGDRVGASLTPSGATQSANSVVRE
jgi:hypothetical protein